MSMKGTLVKTIYREVVAPYVATESDLADWAAENWQEEFGEGCFFTIDLQVDDGKEWHLAEGWEGE